MNAQTRREMAEALAAGLEERIQTMAYPNYGNVKLIDATLREWGLEMAKIAAGAHDPTASDAVFTEVCVAVAETIPAANDQQKGA